MKKLKNKVFLTIFVILTISILTIVTIFNAQDYIRTKNSIINNLNIMSTDKKVIDDLKKGDFYPRKRFGDKRFIDAKVYTVILNDDLVRTIVSYTDNESPSEIENLSNNIISKNNANKTYIGNLYINKYSYKYIEDEMIIIIDNSDTNKKLINNLLSSIIIVSILEVLSVYISYVLSKILIEPVEKTFLKQKEFIADASHELKTPLSVIIASTEAYELDKDKKWIDNIKTESDRMNKLIKDLLDLAKTENDEIKRVYQNNNLSKIVEQSILPLESLMFEKNITLEDNIEQNIMFNSNIDEIKQLISILMDNAIKHSYEKGKVIVNLNENKDGIILEVKNNGDPIIKGDEERIFERFYRSDKSRNRNENRYGLGLAIAKNIVTNHGGKIIAFSERKYTTFRATFKRK